MARLRREILGKNAVRERFFDRVKAWQADPSAHPERDWSGLKLVWDRIRSTFGTEA
jgi:hypothetical protein